MTHATLLREPRSLTAQSFLVLVRDDEDPTARFHRVCDGLVTTPGVLPGTLNSSSRDFSKSFNAPSQSRA